MRNSDRFFIIMKQHERFADESTVVDWGYRDEHDAHADARMMAGRNPGHSYVVLQAVGVHQARVLPPAYTAFNDPPQKLLPRFAAFADEDMLK